jgi:hypothetical protein
VAKNRKRELEEDQDLSTYKKNYSYSPKPLPQNPEKKQSIQQPLQLVKKQTCRCGFHLTDANYSRVRNAFFCPSCCQDYSKEQLAK